jgi:regulator of cell morphogenesis and NO signaling
MHHPRIREAFDALAPGNSFILVSSQDPAPLLDRLGLEQAGALVWRYLEEGPPAWRLEIGRRLPPVDARQTVADVAHRYPGALEVLKRMGINHCCGGHLTLTEAAAASGAPLDELLAALDATRGAAA